MKKHFDTQLIPDGFITVEEAMEKLGYPNRNYFHQVMRRYGITRHRAFGLVLISEAELKHKFEEEVMK